MKLPKSKTGWVFVVIYLAVSGFLVYQAFTCFGLFCDFTEIIAAIPFGFFYLSILQWFNPIAPFENWLYIIPTLLVNSIIYYWLGVGIAKLWTKFYIGKTK